MAWFITFSCYGCHLQGDARGSFDHVRGGSRRFLPPNPPLERYHRELMRQTAFVLDAAEKRVAVRDAIVEVCKFRGWGLLALHIRTTHVHGIVTADCESGPIVNAWKAYATRALRRRLTPGHRKIWGHGANAVHLTSREHIERAVAYILDSQGEAMATYVAEV